MKTQYAAAITQKENGTRLGGTIIREGGLVAFPTETVYGLGANGLDGDAVAKIFEAKGRPNDNPLILHIAKKSDVKQLWTHIPEPAKILMDTFWPGPLTLVFNKSEIIPNEVCAFLPTVALRMPDNKTALALIRAAGVPIAAPSANLSGKPSPTTAAHVREDLDGRVGLIIDGGECKHGLESTVLSLVNRPTILRPGAITKEMLAAVLGEVELAPSILNPLGEGETAASPGMKYRHYAPEAEVFVAVAANNQYDGKALYSIANRINDEYDKHISNGEKAVIFATRQTLSFYKGRNCVIIGDRSEPNKLAAALFAHLRTHGAEVNAIFAEGLPETEIGLAYMNRLLRAASFNFI